MGRHRLRRTPRAATLPEYLFAQAHRGKPMSKDPRSKSPNWKTPGGEKAPPPSRKREWQGSPAPAAKPDRKKSRRGWLFLTLVFAGVLLAAIVILIKLWDPFH